MVFLDKDVHQSFQQCAANFMSSRTYRSLPATDPNDIKWVDFPDAAADLLPVCWPLLGPEPDKTLALVRDMKRALEVSLVLLLPATVQPEVRHDAEHGLVIYLPVSQRGHGHLVAGVCLRVVGKIHLCCHHPVVLRAAWFPDDQVRALTPQLIERAVANYMLKIFKQGRKNYMLPAYKALLKDIQPFSHASNWHGSLLGTDMAREVVIASRTYHIDSGGY